MSFRAGSRHAGLLAPIALSLVVATAPAVAQSPQTPPRPGDAPATAPRIGAPGLPAPGKATGMVEGSVKKIDPGAGNLQISSGPLGMFGRTLEVTSNTQIQVEGRQGTLADLREGSKVKASYEMREGRNFATRIEVMPPEETTKARASDADKKGAVPATRDKVR